MAETNWINQDGNFVYFGARRGRAVQSIGMERNGKFGCRLLLVIGVVQADNWTQRRLYRRVQET